MGDAKVLPLRRPKYRSHAPGTVSASLRHPATSPRQLRSGVSIALSKFPSAALGPASGPRETPCARSLLPRESLPQTCVRRGRSLPSVSSPAPNPLPPPWPQTALPGPPLRRPLTLNPHLKSLRARFHSAVRYEPLACRPWAWRSASSRSHFQSPCTAVPDRPRSSARIHPAEAQVSPAACRAIEIPLQTT